MHIYADGFSALHDGHWNFSFDIRHYLPAPTDTDITDADVWVFPLWLHSDDLIQMLFPLLPLILLHQNQSLQGVPVGTSTAFKSAVGMTSSAVTCSSGCNSLQTPGR